MFRDSEHAAQTTECEREAGEERGEREAAGWLLGVCFGRCGGGRECVCVEVVVVVVFSQSSRAKSCFCVVTSHKPLITSNGMSFVCVFYRKARRDSV